MPRAHVAHKWLAWKPPSFLTDMQLVTPSVELNFKAKLLHAVLDKIKISKKL